MLKGFFRTDGKPTRLEKLTLPLIVPLLALVLYMGAYTVRHVQNPNDKIVPSPVKIVTALWTHATVPRIGDKIPPLWLDTYESLRLLFISLALLIPFALLGLNMGTLPYANLLWGRFIIIYSLIAPMAVTTIIMIFLGLGDSMKVTIVVFATGVVMVRSMRIAARSVPENLIHLAQTRRASEFEIVYSVVWPLIFPQFLEILELSLVPAISYLLLAESQVSMNKSGFMYRMGQATRNNSYDVIYAYALWFVLVTYLLGLAIRLWRQCYPWHRSE